MLPTMRCRDLSESVKAKQSAACGRFVPDNQGRTSPLGIARQMLITLFPVRQHLIALMTVLAFSSIRCILYNRNPHFCPGT